MTLGKLEVSRGFLFLAALLWYLDTDGVLPWAALACAVHELGHLLAIRMCGGRVERVRLRAIGAELCLSAAYPLENAAQSIIALAGPLANLAAAFLSVRPGGGEGRTLFAGLCVVLALFNLLPAEKLDGGRALCFLLGGRAPRVRHAISRASAVLLLALGAALLLKTGNFTLLIPAIWLFRDEEREKTKFFRKKSLHF